MRAGRYGTSRAATAAVLWIGVAVLAVLAALLTAAVWAVRHVSRAGLAVAELTVDRIAETDLVMDPHLSAPENPVVEVDDVPVDVVEGEVISVRFDTRERVA